jgi:predicted RNA-binding protein with PUA-like domain
VSVLGIIRSAQQKAAEAGSPYVTIDHLTPDQVEQLADVTLDWLRRRPSKPSTVQRGWRQVSAAQAGVLPMWAVDDALSDEERKALRPLRRDIYDLLDQQGLIKKPPGQGSPIQVSPAGGALPKGPKVTRENLGAWMVKCNPKVWDLQSFLDDGGEVIDDWSVQENYRSALMEPGDLVFFWVTGTDRQALTPGVWGVGHVVAPSDWAVFQDDADAPEDDGYWLDREARLRATYFAHLDVPLLDEPVPRVDIARDPRLANLEVLTSPQMGNPQYVSPAEAVALLELVGGAPPAPEPYPDEIVVDKFGAAFGDPVKNRVVELAAMDAVTDHLEAIGWRCEDVSAAKCGWDITARREGRERHVEVKGVSGAEPIVLLTRNEFTTSQSDPDWSLMVVTQALSKQTVHEYVAATAVASSEPFVYRLDLS